MVQQDSVTSRGEETTAQELGRRTNCPVVGVIATPENAEAIASCILRSNDEGYDTMVCHAEDQSLEAVSFAEQLDVPTISVDPHGENTHPLETGLVTAAKDIGYPGVVFHEHPDRPIDFEATVEQLYEQEAYLVEAVPTPRVSESAEVLAAIPAYNEEGSIANVVREARKHADKVVVVDDGSTDGTVDLAEEAGATVIQHETNKGYGGALQTAFVEADRCRADHLAVVDGDGQHDPSDIEKLVSVQRESGVEIVIGSRSVAGSETDMPIYRQIGFGVVNFLTNLSMGVVRPQSRVADTQSGFRIYDRAAISSLAEDDIGDNMSASTDILHHAYKNDYAIQEVGTSISYDVEDASSHHPVAHGMQLVGNLIRTIERERPLLLLGVPGFISTSLGVIFVYWTFSNYLSTGTFPISLAVIAGLFGLLGSFTSFTAIILHSLNTHLD